MQVTYLIKTSFIAYSLLETFNFNDVSTYILIYMHDQKHSTTYNIQSFCYDVWNIKFNFLIIVIPFSFMLWSCFQYFTIICTGVIFAGHYLITFLYICIICKTIYLKAYSVSCCIDPFAWWTWTSPALIIIYSQKKKANVTFDINQAN